MGDDGVLTIETANSNKPFTDAEYSDTTDATHKAALANSAILVGPTGNWKVPGEDMSGNKGNLEIYPVSALQGQQFHLSEATFTHKVALIVFGGLDQVESVQNATGKSLPLDQNSAQLDVEPVLTDGPSLPAIPGKGWDGIDQMSITGAKSTIALNAGTKPIQALWSGGAADVTVNALPGHLAATFDPGTTTMAIAPVAHEAAPKSATVSVTDKLKHDATERVLTVTGPAHMTVALTAGGAAVISSASGGHFQVSLSVLGPGAGAQSAVLGAITLPAGDSVSIAPSSWSQLATATDRATISGHGAHRRLTLRNRRRAPAAAVKRTSLSGRLLRVTVAVPALTAGQSSVTLTAVITDKGKVVARAAGTARTGARARREVVSLALGHAVAAGSRLALTVKTVNGGATPTAVSATVRSRLR